MENVLLDVEVGCFLDVVKVPTSFLDKVWILGGYTCPGTLVCCQVEEQPEPTSVTGCEQ
jgi:hypothetical protein